MTIDLLFPAAGGPVRTDHVYHLYATLSRAVPAFHDPTAGLRFAPLPGVRGPAAGTLALSPGCKLRVRLPQERIGEVLALAGRRLELGDSFVRLGVPAVVPLTPAATLASRAVVVKPHTEVGPFADAVRRKLAEAGLGGEVAVPVRLAGKRGPEPCRRVVRVKGKVIVGYAVTVCGLSAADSLRLQAEGLGGRRRLGCGFFLPVRPGVV